MKYFSFKHMKDNLSLKKRLNNMNKNYEVLGLPLNASKDLIKKTYKDLARKVHPDKGGTEEKFNQINEAYTQIMKEDPAEEFKELFENILSGLSGLGMGGMGGIGGIGGIGGMGGINTGLESIIKGPLIKTKLKITLEQLELGGTFLVSYKRKVPTGNFINSVSQTPFGVMNIITPEETDKLFETEIYLPKCYDQRKPLILEKFAKADHLPLGDLEVNISIVEHQTFTRINGSLDLQMEIDITLKESLIGFDRQINPLNSSEPLKIECRSIVNPYDIKKIQKYGMKYNDEVYGDLLIKFRIQFPILLSENAINSIRTYL